MQGKSFKLIFFIVGFVLFSYLVSLSNLDDIANQILFLGFDGFFVVLFIFILYFGSDSLSWQITFTSIKFDFFSGWRFFVVRMVGEAYNNITPAASLGGEPLKAWILKKNYQISYVDSTSALIISKTVSMLSLIGFISLAFLLSLDNPRLSSGQRSIAAMLLCLSTFVVIVFLILQRTHLVSKLANLINTRLSKQKFKRFFKGLKEVDETFNRFYSNHKKQLLLSFCFASFNWFLGVVELYLIFFFLGTPLSWEEALLLESLIQSIRTMTFFIPSAIGTQEGAFFVGSQILVGVAELGLAASLVRRARDLIWIFLGLALSLNFELKR